MCIIQFIYVYVTGYRFFFQFEKKHWPGVGAIDSPDLFEQVLERYIPEVSEKNFF